VRSKRASSSRVLFETERRQIDRQRFARLGESVARDRGVLKEISGHPALLSALTGKHYRGS
jgi:hypothetical protein